MYKRGWSIKFLQKLHKPYVYICKTGSKVIRRLIKKGDR